MFFVFACSEEEVVGPEEVLPDESVILNSPGAVPTVERSIIFKTGKVVDIWRCREVVTPTVPICARGVLP